MVEVYLGLGSNLGERENNVWRAVDRMEANPRIRIVGVSTLLNTAAIGPIEQPEYINAVAHIQTDLEPLELLEVLLEIERRMGRIRKEKWGPRIIDLDILYYGDKTVDLAELKIPHPEIANREFLKEGLKELGKKI